jgi:trehalose 6-phosphate synthase/phosphatase
LIAANRLPVTVGAGTHGIELVPSSGGLATGLGAWHERSNSLWFGWPGQTRETAAPDEALLAPLRALRMVPIQLSSSQVEGHYHGYANRVLWPLFHYSIDRLPIDGDGWIEYREVNEAFAREIAREYRPGDSIWIHDYHLLLLPALLRQRLPHAQIGFFLHIPFPSSEVFRVLPHRREILQGLLGADLIGFHTFGYMRHFMTSLLHVDGVEADVDRLTVAGRHVQVAVFPMGIDSARFAALAGDPDVRARVEAIRRDAGGRTIVLGVDRLDYTKGIPRRLEAIARLLDRDPALRDRMRYVQVAVPSRGEVDSYQRFRRGVEEAVGRLNGSYATLQSLPIHYVHQSVSTRELVALYCAADVMLVTPLRDGMNLVAKEFAASRIDEDGVLVLSEFAGAAAELHGAVSVNPYDIHALADAISRALSMRAEERRARIRALRRQVSATDVFAWADRFVRQLHSVRSDPPRLYMPPAPGAAAAVARAGRSHAIRLLLDYDGTLVPLARSPELAVPDDEVMRLLERLAASPGVAVDMVSGRPRQFLERWFGHLPISLWAEHGFWHRGRSIERWEAAAPLTSTWITRVRPILEQFVASTPGSRVEMKSASMAWHYRGAARDVGRRQAHELRLLLGDLLSNQPLEVLEGKKVIEIRLRGVSKALVARRIRAENDPDSTIVAIGDDQSDDELFRALPAESLTVAVGPSAATAARFRVADCREVRRLLRSLLEDRDAAGHQSAAATSYESTAVTRHAAVVA